jgi:hypothetical protein
MRKFRTTGGGVIVIPPKTEDHLRAHPEVANILPEAFGRIMLPSVARFLETEVEMGRVVGRSGRVTTPTIALCNPALFAQRIGRNKPSRVAPKGVAGEETTKVAVLASPSRQESGTYVLVTAWVGSLARKEPWDPTIRSQEEYQDCLRFWCSNALVWDPAVMSEPFESSWEGILK